MRAWWLVFTTACGFSTNPLDHTDAGRSDGPADSRRILDVGDGSGSTDDAVALWEFADGSGDTVTDTGRAPPLDLTIDKPSHVAWGNSSLIISNDVRIESAGPATKIIDAAKAANAITLEAWITPASDGQVGPARVAGISFDAINRDISLMQDGGMWAYRLRTTATDNNGQPDVDSGATIQVVPQRQYVVVTEDGTDRVIYVDGVEAGRDQKGGSFANWDETYTAILANDHVGTDRPWHGTLDRVAIYDRVFTADEILARDQAGPPSR
jgi:hypothetical protein